MNTNPHTLTCQIVLNYSLFKLKRTIIRNTIFFNFYIVICDIKRYEFI